MSYHFILLLVPLSPLYIWASQAEKLSPTESDQKISVSETSKRAFAAELKSSLERVPSFYETEIIEDGRKVLFRRVAPPAELPSAKPKASPTTTSPVNFSDLIEESKEPINLKLYVTVYDEAYSKLILTVEENRYTVWTNLNFAHLQMLGSFETEERRYSYFGMSDKINQEREALNARFAKEKGFDYTSRWKASPVQFSEEPEYVLVTEDESSVPNEVYQQFDDLLGYYLDNKERLKVVHHNAQELQAARERYKAAHPEEPQDIVLNYSRLSTPAE